MYPKGGSSLYSPCHLRLLSRAVTCGETTLKQSVPEGLYTTKRIHAGVIIEELRLWEGPHAGTGERDVEEEAAEEKY